VLEAALKIIGHRPPETAKVMRIRNTLTLSDMEMSEPCLENGHRSTRWKMLGPRGNWPLPPTAICRRCKFQRRTERATNRVSAPEAGAIARNLPKLPARQFQWHHPCLA